MKFLTKIGQIIVKGLQIITGLEPMVQTLNPQAGQTLQVVSKDLAQIGDIIIKVEAFGQSLGLAGADKLRAAAPQVAQIVLQSAMLANHQIADGPLFTAGCMKIADGMADVINSLKDNVETVNKAA